MLTTIVNLCAQNDDIISQTAHEQIIVALTPLLENNHPTQEICSFFTKVCLCTHCITSFRNLFLLKFRLSMKFVGRHFVQERRTRVTDNHNKNTPLSRFCNVLVSVTSCKSDRRLFQVAGPD